MKLFIYPFAPGNQSGVPGKAWTYAFLNDDGLEEEDPVPPLEDPTIPVPESWRRGDPCYPIFVNLPSAKAHHWLV